MTGGVPHSSDRRVRARRKELVARLRVQRREIEDSLLLRISTVGDLSSHGPEYHDGVRAAVADAVEHGLAILEVGERRAPPLPDSLLNQARLAARSGVGAETVLRRYVVAHHAFARFVTEAVEKDRSSGAGELAQLLASQWAVFERICAEVSHAYEREARRQPYSESRRLLQLIQRLLDGEPIDTSDVPYTFEYRHIGVVAEGSSVSEAMKVIAADLDAQRLWVYPHDGMVWAWIGTRQPVDLERLHRSIDTHWPRSVPLGLGEVGEGLDGWRLTHRQARDAFPVALRDGCITRYEEVGLLASIERDPTLSASLRQRYADPLGDDNRGEELRQTIKVYLAVGRNSASAAAVLGCSRQAVAARLKTAALRLGRPVASCGPELELALRLRR